MGCYRRGLLKEKKTYAIVSGNLLVSCSYIFPIHNQSHFTILLARYVQCDRIIIASCWIFGRSKSSAHPTKRLLLLPLSSGSIFSHKLQVHKQARIEVINYISFCWKWFFHVHAKFEIVQAAIYLFFAIYLVALI